jgi:hypothetical protein
VLPPLDITQLIQIVYVPVALYLGSETPLDCGPSYEADPHLVPGGWVRWKQIPTVCGLFGQMLMLQMSSPSRSTGRQMQNGHRYRR